MAWGERTGIAVAGSVLVDKLNEIRAYPQCGELTQIVRLSKTVDGFNAVDVHSLKAVIRAAEELYAPIAIMFAQLHEKCLHGGNLWRL